MQRTYMNNQAQKSSAFPTSNIEEKIITEISPMHI